MPDIFYEKNFFKNQKQLNGCARKVVLLSYSLILLYRQKMIEKNTTEENNSPKTLMDLTKEDDKVSGVFDG